MKRLGLRDTTLVLVAGIGMTDRLRAGELNPPPGPVGPTMKTLAEVEPRVPIGLLTTPGDGDSLFKITQSGSYYLTGNVQGIAGKMGIEVVASHVTIDLRGFELAGTPGSLAGIDLNNGAVGNIYGVTIKDGTIRGWGSDGIKGNQSGADHFSSLEVTAITGYGIFVNSGTTIENCVVSGCSLDGIGTSNNVVIQNTVSGGNALNGINAGTASTITTCQAGTNGGAGIVISGGKGTIANCNAPLNGGVGIDGRDGSTVSNCHADTNGQSGISVGEGGVISHSAANDNTGNGINTGSTSTVVACSAWSNDLSGIFVTQGSIIGCTARENGDDGIKLGGGGIVKDCTSADNLGDGISTGTGCTIAHCTITSNAANGIILTSRANVHNCTAYSNTLDGIRFSSDCRIEGNICTQNGNAGDGAGIHAAGFDNRIDSNSVTDNDRGIDVDFTGNLILRNSASGNTTNYEIAADNRYGPIINITGSGTVAVSGNSAVSTMNTTDPWANLSY